MPSLSSPSVPEPDPESVFDFDRGLVAGGSDYVGYSEASLKRVVLRTVSGLPGMRVVDIGAGRIQ